MRIALSAVVLILFSSLAHAFALPTDGSDVTPMIDAEVAGLCAPGSSSRTLRLPAGEYHLHTRPKAIPCAVTMYGEGKGATRLVRRYSGGSFLWWTRGTDQSGGGLRDIQLEAGPGTHGGIAVWVQALADPNANSNSLNRHSFLIDNVLIGRTVVDASWDNGIYFDGALNPDNAIGVAPGIRLATVRATSVAGTRAGSIVLNKARGAIIEAECYIPLNGSATTARMLGGTQNVLLASKTCVLTRDDATNFDGVVVTYTTKF